VSATDVAEEPLSRWVDPPDDPGGVEDVARDGYAGERPLGVAADRQPASRWSHADSVVDQGLSRVAETLKGAVADALHFRVELVLR
jgi:hypothetical protein